MTKKFEHKLVPQSNVNNRRSDMTENVEMLLDSYGRDGWELCGIDYGCFIFKREIEEDE